MNFYDWMISKYRDKNTPRGDLAEDMVRSGDFPKDGDYNSILKYLHRKGACEECVNTFKRCWRDFQRTCKNGNQQLSGTLSAR